MVCVDPVIIAAAGTVRDTFGGATFTVADVG